MSWSQIVLTTLMVLGLFKSIKEGVEGRPAREPPGTVGVVVSLVIFGGVFFLYWHSWFWSSN